MSTPITRESLEAIGFRDYSPDGNGLALRYRFNYHLDICFYSQMNELRLQTVGSGFTMPLHGVKTIEGVKQLIHLIQGQKQ